MKIRSNGIRPSWSLIWEKRARALREERRIKEEEEGEENFRYGNYLCMDYYGFVWICELLYGFLDSWSSSLSRVLL